MFVERGFNKSCIFVDTDELMLKIGGKEVVQAKVKDFTLSLKWCDGKWESWQELQASSELSSITGDVQKQLSKAKDYGGGKGKGKGPE